ncbi:hypothetical protein NDU88_010194 [Pleurodeles waltl]|uniref:Uncharacterized protein n=1 Tax=Pleurodeles waltl TaxID=8319 RepID=A0AAV7PU80_PLEWA|nr:hypothetical protein NDU88_010194 [Pleurodeles waltl]
MGQHRRNVEEKKTGSDGDNVQESFGIKAFSLVAVEILINVGTPQSFTGKVKIDVRIAYSDGEMSYDFEK